MAVPPFKAAIPIVAIEPPRGLAILGDPVEASLSPIFQQAALDAAGIALRYERRGVGAAELATVLQTWRHTGMAGNVTMPHKERVAALVDRLTPIAQRAGAVNTIWVEHEQLVGHNTDVDGVIATIRALCPTGIDGGVVVVGAGGATAAVLLALEACGARDVLVVARNVGQASALIERVGVHAGVARMPADTAAWQRLFRTCTSPPVLVVNATPIGMASADAAIGMPVPLAALPRGVVCFDLVYRLEETAWVRGARAIGCHAEDGLRMLLEQGAAAFECWFARPAPRAVMWESVGRDAPTGTRVDGPVR